MRLERRIALVTGASSGIGLALAPLLAERGATLALAGRDAVALAGIAVSVVVPGVVDTPFFDRRGSAYDRSWPAPIPAQRVARALLRAISSDRAEVFAPAWIRLPARFKGAAPGLYRRLALRFGQAGR